MTRIRSVCSWMVFRIEPALIVAVGSSKLSPCKAQIPSGFNRSSLTSIGGPQSKNNQVNKQLTLTQRCYGTNKLCKTFTLS